MLYILHGDDITASRKRLSELASNYTLISYISADKTNFTEIVNVIYGTEMFLQEKCIVIENILKLSRTDLEKVSAVFEKVSKNKNITLILWQESEMTKIQTAKYKGAIIESFMLPKLFFTFLDNFTPHNTSFELKILSQIINVDEMQIFYALIKRTRQLLMIKSGGNFEEIIKMNPWQVSKLKAQSARWNPEQLKSVYNIFFETEKKLKSSNLMLPLKKHLDILITKALS